MKGLLVLLALAVPVLLADSVEYGSLQFPNTKPLCAG
jgi:hypothetical protein